MPINPNIAMGYRPIQLENPMNAMVQMSQIQNYQQANQFNQMKMEEYRSGVDRKNRLGALMQGSVTDGKFDPAKYSQALYGGGYGKEAQAFGKYQSEQATAEVTRTKAEVDLVDAKLKQMGKFLSEIDPDSPYAPAIYKEWHAAKFRDPILGPQFKQWGLNYDQARWRIEEAVDKGQDAFKALLYASQLGIEKFMEMNKSTTTVVDQSGKKTIVQIPGLVGPTVNRDYADVPLPAEVEAQKVRIALAGRTPAATVPAPLKDPKQIAFEQFRKENPNATAAEMNQAIAGAQGVMLSEKDRQSREAKYPAALSAVKTFEVTSSKLESDLRALAVHPGLASITGIVAGRLPGITAEGRAAQALYDSIIAKGGFSELNAMRASSPTGAALGPVSDTEGKYLRAAFAPLDRTQDAANVIEVLLNAADATKTARQNIREALDLTYEYRKPAAPLSSETYEQRKARLLR